MRSIKFAAAAAALSLVSAPVLAQADSASSSVEAEDAGANRTALFVVLGLIAVIIGIVGIGGGDDNPVSA